MKDKELRIINGQECRWDALGGKWLPTQFTDEKGIPCLLDPETMTYQQQLTYTTDPAEQKLLEEPVGKYGLAWKSYMKENHSAEAEMLKIKCRWEILVRKIDTEAWEMYELLQSQYHKNNPLPQNNNFMEMYKYNETMDFYIDHEIMKQVVFQLRSA